VAELIWSPRATADLAELGEYIGRDSDHYARLFIQRIISAVENLTQFPELGRVVPEYRRPELRELLFQNYRIVYRHLAATIEIVAVVHSARRLPDIANPGG
jgi:plasmid stabilization system protein ParE